VVRNPARPHQRLTPSNLWRWPPYPKPVRCCWPRAPTFNAHLTPIGIQQHPSASRSGGRPPSSTASPSFFVTGDYSNVKVGSLNVSPHTRF
jgi:hypothetical protein